MKLDKRACRHAANVPLHISLNAGVLYTERVKYLVTAAVKLLGGHRVLAVYFYECERLKANDRMPKWVVFQGKDTFATLERDAEGNVKWRDAMVQHLTDYYMGDFLQSCVFYKKAGCHTIARYIGAKSDPTKVLWELNWYQQDIRDQQTKIRRYKRDTVVLNKMSSVPQTPANLKRWADKHIMPHYLFYDYNNGRVKTQVYCTYCEKFSVIKRPKNNDVLRCPKCDQKVIAKAQGRRAAYYEDRETCQVVQQISPHELVVRIYKLYWSYVKGKDTTRKSAYEVMRIFVCGDDGKKATIEPYYYSRDYDSVTHWRHGHHPGALFGIECFISEEIGAIYLPGLEKVLYWWSSDPAGEWRMPLPGFHYFGTICPEVLKAGGILVVPPGQRYNYHVRNHKPHFSRRYQAMRIILKLLAAPFVLALTLLVAVLNFAFSFASWVFRALSFLCLIGALFALFTGDRWGIQGLVIAFAVSPFGLPAVAEWLIDKLDSLNYSLKSFITG